MSLFNTLLNAYRRVFKRMPGVHRLTYLVGSTIVVPMFEKATGFFTPKEDPLNFRLKLLLNQWEPETVAFFRKVIKPGMVVLDIGAHVGYYSRLFATLVGPDGLVIAVEPHPETFLFLKKNLQGYSNVKCLQFAAGESETSMELIDSSTTTGGASLGFQRQAREREIELAGKELAPRIKAQMPIRKFTVNVRPLDQVLAELGVKNVHVMKIDIEGAECLALKGMRQTLETVEVAVCELAPSHLLSFGFSPHDLLTCFMEAGLQTFYLLDSEHPRLISEDQLKRFAQAMHIGEYVNIVAARQPI